MFSLPACCDGALREYSSLFDKVKTFLHGGGHKHHQPGVFSSLVPQNVIPNSNKPSMEELLNHIDMTSNHQKIPPVPLSTPNDHKAFNNFEITPNVVQEQPKQDVFQIFQKVPEKFSFVKDINQNFAEIENDIESTTNSLQITEINPNIFSESTEEPDSTPGKLFADDPGNLRTVVIQPDKKNAKSFSSASSASTSSSGLIRWVNFMISWFISEDRVSVIECWEWGED